MLENATVNRHSSLRIECEKVIYFDPYKIDTASHDADIIFFTHSHFDHLSEPDVEKVCKNNTIYVAPLSDASELKKVGITPEKTILFTPGESKEVLGFPVEAIPAYNVRKLFHPKKNKWLGYVITIDKTRYYVCGDMDHTPEGEAVNCDVVFVPIGGKFTMNAKQAAAFVNSLAPKVAVPFHYNDIIGTAKDFDTFKGAVNNEIEVVKLI